MNNKEHKKQQEQQNINEEQEVLEQTDEQEPKQNEKETQEKNEDWKQEYLRIAAEYDNYRKRIQREFTRVKQETEEKVWREIFPLIDDIYRAIAASAQSDNIEKIKEGLKLIQDKIEKLFAKNDIAPIPDKGHEFDSNLHEAIAWIETPQEEQKGKVIDVVEKGYKKGDKVIKHSKVVVGK